MFTLFAPHVSLGATKDVTITWTMSDTSDVVGYKMYYSYSSNMADKLFACQTDDTAANTLTCRNVELSQSPVYFVIAALTTAGEVNSNPVAKTLATGISIVQEFRLDAL